MNKTRNIYRGVVGLIVLAALLLSLFDQLTVSNIPTVCGRFLGYISYFTELSNILAQARFCRSPYPDSRTDGLQSGPYSPPASRRPECCSRR